MVYQEKATACTSILRNNNGKFGKSKFLCDKYRKQEWTRSKKKLQQDTGIRLHSVLKVVLKIFLCILKAMRFH